MSTMECSKPHGHAEVVSRAVFEGSGAYIQVRIAWGRCRQVQKGYEGAFRALVITGGCVKQGEGATGEGRAHQARGGCARRLTKLWEDCL